MANTGFTSPTSARTTSEAFYDDNSWFSPTNIYSSNDTYAYMTEATFTPPDYTTILYAQGFDFSGIPAGSTIDGVVVRIEAKAGSATDATLALCKLLGTNGFTTGTNKADGWYPGTADSLHDIGGASDLWGNALTLAWVQDTDFGVGISFQAKAFPADIYVDHVQMDVYYTAPATTLGKVNIGGSWKTVNKVQVNIGGTWKDVSSIKVNVGGAWKTLT